jgi:hypothetical protein
VIEKARAAIVLVLTVTFSLASPVSSPAAVTIGNQLSTTGLDNGPCNSSSCTVSTRPPTGTSTIEAPGGLLSPVDGVVTSWRFASGSSGNQVSLRVLRLGIGFVATGAGTSAAQTSLGGISGPFLTQLPIKAGDTVGLNATIGATILRPTAEASSTGWTPTLPDGATLAGTNVGSEQTMVEATVEPDVDCDGRGDETQDTNLNDGPCGDHAAPVQKLTAKKRQRLAKAAVFEGLDQQGVVSLRARVKVPSRSHARTVRVLARAVKSKRSRATLAAGRKTKIKLKFTARARRKIKAAIRASGPRRVVATAKSTDALGNRSTAKVRFKLVG